MAYSKTKRAELSAQVILSRGEKTFNIVNVVVLTLFGLICLYPLLFVFSSSISYGPAVDAGKVLLWPQKITLDAYKYIFADKIFWSSYGNTLYYTFFGTLFSMAVSTPAAYVLSQRRFRPRRIINLLLAFTMWFTPGFIPLYLNYASLGVVNNRVMIVISFGIQAFYIFLLRNYFETIPNEINESAMIDGARDFRIFWNLYLPLSTPALATVGLYYAMSRWNGFFWTSVLIKDVSKISLQVYLKQKIVDQALAFEFANTIADINYSATTLVYALVFCSVLPILIIYPFTQRFFVKGVMVGGVKG